MTIRHTVVEGDSLWRLAHRHLGSGTKWPIIFNTHNTEAARFGQHSRLIPIENENLIYVGQTLVIPVSKNARNEEGNGSKKEGSKSAVPFDLKIKYTIGQDTPPLLYISNHIDFTVNAEISGDIEIEMISPGKYRHTFEVIISKSPNDAKLLLAEAYDPALVALTTKPEIGFESGQVKIKSPITTKAGLGPYTLEVQAETPTHMSGVLKPQPISGKVKIKGREYLYIASIELKADVIWHPRPTDRIEQVKGFEPAPENKGLRAPKNARKTWGEVVDENGGIIATVGLIILGTALLLYTRGSAMIEQTTSIAPYIHKINYQKYET